MCQEFGAIDALPADCEDSCIENGELSLSFDCIRCRGAGALRLDGLAEGLQAGLPFDPARVTETINEISAGLDEDGEQCFRRVAESASLMRTRLQRWNDNNPSQEEEVPDELVVKSVADIQTELDDMAEASEALENEFSADAAGEAFRADMANAGTLLQGRISDEHRPNACGAEFDELKDSYNAIVDEYAALPQTLQDDGVERVSLNFADRDIGTTDLTDASSVCGFALNLVDNLKTAADNHKTRLDAAQEIVCVRAGQMVRDGKLEQVSSCLREAKRAAEESGDETARQAIMDDIDRFDNNGFERVNTLVGVIANKCLMRETEESPLTRIDNLFRGNLVTTVTTNDGSDLTDDQRGAIAERISTAVQAQHPEARNIETTFGEDSGRRQLRPRRLSIAVATAYDLNRPGRAGDLVRFGGEDLGSDLADVMTVAVTSDSVQPSSSATIAMTAPIQEIDTQLPTGEGAGNDNGDNDGNDGGDPTETPATDGAQDVVLGAVAALATLLFV